MSRPLPEDLLGYHSLSEHGEYSRIRSIYAEALAYALKLPFDDVYPAQSLAYRKLDKRNRVYLVTTTPLGVYAQLTPGEYFPVEFSELDLIKTL